MDRLNLDSAGHYSQVSADNVSRLVTMSLSRRAAAPTDIFVSNPVAMQTAMACSNSPAAAAVSSVSCVDLIFDNLTCQCPSRWVR